MLIKNPEGLVKFSIFEKFPNLVCCQTTKIWEKRYRFLDKNEKLTQLSQQLNIEPNKIWQMHQVHGTTIRYVNDNLTSLLPSDGLISTSTNQFLIVRVADCLPLFFYDKASQSVGVLHAGWRGILHGIIEKFMQKWQKRVNLLETTFVAIGPHIGGCCYTVDLKRANRFFNAGWKKALYQEKGVWHLQLGYVVWQQLLATGFDPVNIEAPIVCTSCQNDIYYSYRKDGQETDSMWGIIGVKT